MNHLRRWIFVLAVGWVSNTVEAVEPPITALAFAPDGTSVVAVSQSGANVYGWPKLVRQRTLKPSASNLHCLAFSPDGKQLAIGGGNPSEDGDVEVFSWPDGKKIAQLKGHRDSVRSVAWLDNVRLISASLDREIKVWDLAKPKVPQFVLKGHSRSVDAICLLKDGQSLVSAGVDQSLRVWDLGSGKLVRSLNQHTKPVHALALRPGTGALPMVASAAGDRSLRFWQPTIGRMMRYVRLDAEPLGIAWLGDGSLLLACCVDGHVRVVDPVEVKVMQTLPAFDGWVYAIAVHPKGDLVVVGGSDGQVRQVVLDVKR